LWVLNDTQYRVLFTPCCFAKGFELAPTIDRRVPEWPQSCAMNQVSGDSVPSSVCTMPQSGDTRDDCSRYSRHAAAREWQCHSCHLEYNNISAAEATESYMIRHKGQNSVILSTILHVSRPHNWRLVPKAVGEGILAM